MFYWLETSTPQIPTPVSFPHTHTGQLHILMILILSLFWVSLLVVHPEGCQQSLQRVCVSSVYLVVLIFILSGLIEPGSPALMVDLRYRDPVYLDYRLTSYFIRTCRDIVLYSRLSRHSSYSLAVHYA